MSQPDELAPSPPSPSALPGARRLLVYRGVELAWILAVQLLVRLSFSFFSGSYKELGLVISVGWILFSGVHLALLHAFARELGGHPAARGLRTAFGILAVDFLLMLAQLVGTLGGPELLHFSGEFGRPLSWTLFTAISLGFDLVLWFALERLVDAPSVRPLRAVYLVLRMASLAFGAINLLSLESLHKLTVITAFGLIFPWVRLGLTVVENVLVILLLQRVVSAVSQGSPAAGSTGPAPLSDGKRDILWGSLWLLAGLAVTLGSYNAASSGSGGGHYVVTTGAIAYGLVRLGRGLVKGGR